MDKRRDFEQEIRSYTDGARELSSEPNFGKVVDLHGHMSGHFGHEEVELTLNLLFGLTT